MVPRRKNLKTLCMIFGNTWLLKNPRQIKTKYGLMLKILFIWGIQILWARPRVNFLYPSISTHYSQKFPSKPPKRTRPKSLTTEIMRARHSFLAGYTNLVMQTQK